VIAGGISFQRMPVDAYPDLSPPMVEIITQWPGHAAEEIERLVTLPTEVEMNGVPKMAIQRSISLYGLSDVILTFDENTDDYFARQPRLLRPANYPEAPGRGAITYRARNGTECAVINLQGRTYMPATDCPFRKADQLLSELDPAVKVRFVDFHAEVTSEKMAMGWYLDGRVSAMVGTHTHVPTADTRILAGGTAYQTDCGMTGPYHSVIGVQTDIVIQRFLTGRPVRMEAARTGPELHAVIVDVDEATGKARAVRRHAIDGD